MLRQLLSIFALTAVLAFAGCNKTQADKHRREPQRAQVEGGLDSQGPTDASTAHSPKSLADASISAAAGQPPLRPTSKPRCKDPALTAAMIRFVQALRAQDVETLLSLFPKRRPLKVVSAIAGSGSFPFKQASEEMRSRDRNEGLYSILVDAPDPTFAQFVMDGVEWTWAGGTRFVQDGGNRDDHVYVTWRKEDGRWVVDTIGFPMA